MLKYFFKGPVQICSEALTIAFGAGLISPDAFGCLCLKKLCKLE